MLQPRGTVLTGLALGASVMYFLDPDRGRARRARMRDQLTHAVRVSGDALGATGRDVAHRTTGAAARVRGMLHHDAVDDDVLVERVRAQIGRAVSHPRAIQVHAEKGLVTLTGPVLTAEIPRLVRATERVRGVREVIAALEQHDEPGNVPALQGETARASRRRRESSAGPRERTATARLMTGTSGLAAASVDVSRRHPAGILLALAGIGLLARATSGRGRRRRTDETQELRA